MNDEEFQNLLNRDGFLEWERFGGYRYGTPWASIQESLDRGRTVLLEIDVGGALQVKRRDPTATLIFIAPPRVEELRHRLLKRGTDSAARIEERLGIAREELEAAAQFDHVVVNDELGAAVAAVARILGA
jgi:guanylate kinase